MRSLKIARQTYVQFIMSFSTQVLKCDPASISFQPSSELPHVTCAETLESLREASHFLNFLQPIAFPTETVYGLGALALNASAVSRIFSIKGRPMDNPLIVHVSSMAMLHTLIPKDYTLPRAYQALIKHFWPGPMTLLFPADHAAVPPIVTANQPTIAIRMPSHSVARALIAITNAPLAAPSANSSGKPSPTRADHVLRDLEGKIKIILDGGACGVGLESTVIDGLHQDGNIRVLRPGGITVEQIESVLRQEMGDGDSRKPQVLVHRLDYHDKQIEQAPTTPGLKYRHYSPSVPLVILLTTSLAPQGVERTPAMSYLASLKSFGTNGSPVKVGIMTPVDSALGTCVLPVDGLEWHRYLLGPTAEPAVTAQRLFDGLFTLEREGVDLILIEEVKAEREGLAVMNRVNKAATKSEWITVQQDQPGTHFH